MKNFKNKVNLAKKVALPLPEKEILWAGQDGGCGHFPASKNNIIHRKHAHNPTPLDTFRDAIIKAQERVWMVDEYLFIPHKGNPHVRVETILSWLHMDIAADDIRFITAYHDEISADLLSQFKQRAEDINNRQSRRKVKCNITINTNLRKKIDYLHDRFAIIDDELWHFGATVGGFHSSVNAVSRGWRASEHGAIDFFEMLWNECE